MKRRTAICLISLALTAVMQGGQVDNMLTYEPYRMVHSRLRAATVNRFLAQLDAHNIGQAFLQTPQFDDAGRLTIPKVDQTMFGLWVQQATTYNAAHGTDITVTAIFNGAVKTGEGGLDLDDPATRARMVAGIESVLSTGVIAVHLDLEPYPVTPGFLALLNEIRAVFTRMGVDGKLSVVAPGYAYRWTPSYLNRVSQLVSQLNPLYYDSGLHDPIAYQDWIARSLSYYSTHTAGTAKIIPVIPSYSANPYHRPEVENIDTATTGLANALGAGSRVNGAGIWWWYGFYYDEEGAYDASADRAAWQSRTLQLPFSP
jgi:hypothetical protein